MKRLTLVRHGHAEARSDEGDFHRALSPLGRTEISRSAAAISARVSLPDAMIASEALRTRETAQLLREYFGSTVNFGTTQRLYHASAPTLLEVIGEAPDSTEHLLLVGHNPGLSELAVSWSRKFPDHASFGGLVTAGWCSATFDTEHWSSISSPLDVVFG